MGARTVRVGLSAALLVVLAGCGADDGSDAAGTTPTSSAARPSSTTAHTHETEPVPVPDDAGLPVTDDGTFDPARISLAGTVGATAEEVERAEDLLVRTVTELPKWADAAVAEADGYVSFQDAATGDEHLINWDIIEDDVILDPRQPEALVYSTSQGRRVLEAAMFILPSRYTLDSLPELGGELTQFHVHRDLCVASPPARSFAGLRSPDGPCSQGEPFPTWAMVHVWIRPHPCGPFAALEGVGGGQIAEGEARSCHHEHG